MHGFCLSKPPTTYEAKAKSDRETMTKMFNNIHTLCQHGQYPDALIFNMDETWVSTEKKHPEDTLSILLTLLQSLSNQQKESM